MDQERNEPGQNTSDSVDWEPKRSKWPMVIAALFVVGVGFGVWKLFFDVKLHPTKILIIVETEDSEGAKGRWWGAKGKVSARYADAMATHLKTLGFETFSGADPEFLAAMEETNSAEEIMELARSRGIQWILAGTIRVTNTMPIKGDDDQRIDLIVTTELDMVNTTEAQKSEPPTRVTLRSPDFFLKWQTDFESALEKHNVELLADQHIADVARTLVSTEVLSAYATTDQETSEATVVASKLEPLFQLARRYELAFEARAKTLNEDEERENKRRATPSSRLFTPLDTTEAYVGESADGGIVTQVESRETFFSVKRGQFISNKTTDELVLTSPDGKNRKSLFRTYNIFSHPNVSSDGRWIGVVVDHHTKGSSIVRISTEDGSVEELLFTKREYVSDVFPSPDGSHMLYMAASCASCNKEIRVLSVGEKEPRRVFSPELTAMTTFPPQWSPDGKTLFFASERDGFMRSIWSLTLPSLTFTPLAGNALPPTEKESAEAESAEKSVRGENELAEAPSLEQQDDVIDQDPPEYTLEDVSNDGTSLLLRERRDVGGRKTLHLVELELSSGKQTELTELEKRDHRGRYSATGKNIAYRTSRNTNLQDPGRFDWEIALLDRATKNVTTLTANSDNEFFLDFARQSNRLYYHIERRYHDGPCGLHCRRILWMEP